MTDPRPGPSTRLRVSVVEDNRVRVRADLLATEEPMEIRIVGADGQRRTVAITMRTPGRDFELAAGFLFAGASSRGVAVSLESTTCGDPT